MSETESDTQENETAVRETEVMDTLPVAEYWQTIQGEATHAGRPSVFVRMQGCPVGCPWCDTKYTWHLKYDQMVDLHAIATKDGSHSETWANVHTAELVQEILRFKPQHVVLTGGEPCLYDLTWLTTELHNRGRSVQIETSGTQPIRCDARTWVTVSPKLNMPGGFRVRPDAIARADEIKMPIGKPADLELLFGLLREYGVQPRTPVWLQPLSRSQNATNLCYQAALANNLRVSLQLHAFAGWR